MMMTLPATSLFDFPQKTATPTYNLKTTTVPLNVAPYLQGLAHGDAAQMRVLSAHRSNPPF